MNRRRTFIKQSAALVFGSQLTSACNWLSSPSGKTAVDAHLWVYASRFPPDWDCTSILDEVFADLKAAGYAGIELMESILLHEGAAERLKGLISKHNIPVTGTSFYGDMWNREAHQAIIEKIDRTTSVLAAVGGRMIGLTVGDAGRKKTEYELDLQAMLLEKIVTICAAKGITPNLHNHSFEMEHDMFDFKGTMERVPALKLGPDFNWMIRGGVDPVWFIEQYGQRMVYMHLRDQDADGRWTEALGQGSTDFAAIAKALQKINYQGRAAVELAFEGEPVAPVRDSWISSRQYVKKIFGW